MTEEELLSGGHVNTVVRVGATVRRSAGAWTPTIHRLLAHARGCGLGWLPEPLGYDQRGREVLSYISGDVPHEMPNWVWSEQVLTDVASALRQWHDATASFDAADTVWQLDAQEPREVICHNDFAPYNCVFRAARFAAAIDFDFCSPGPRLWDIAYTTYRFVPLMPPAAADVPDGARERSPFTLPSMQARLALFLAAYAQGQSALLYAQESGLSAVARRLEALAAWTEEHAARTGHTSLKLHGPMYRAHAQWIAHTKLGSPACP